LSYDELFYRRSDAVVFQRASMWNLPDRGYANQRVRIQLRREPPLVQIGEEQLDATQVVHLEAVTE
jgi:hypothetical protein